MVPDHADRQVGDGQHRDHCHAHHDRCRELSRDRERGADPEDLKGNRVIIDDRLEEDLAITITHDMSPPSRSQARNGPNPSSPIQYLMVKFTPLAVSVAPESPSTW